MADAGRLDIDGIAEVGGAAGPGAGGDRQVVADGGREDQDRIASGGAGAVAGGGRQVVADRGGKVDVDTIAEGAGAVTGGDRQIVGDSGRLDSDVIAKIAEAGGGPLVPVPVPVVILRSWPTVVLAIKTSLPMTPPVRVPVPVVIVRSWPTVIEKM